ncbi:MFS transporter [Acidiferrimicrobium sp. IK]|uniref:MFS transporter n=1 Tax=Acidiferrimicrobium sp. IK TaxID=2871700 RepID=UPI0021CAFF96|nr:MFS transporter [Acidiferrimicrobium sp. IK]MCU4182742.1 MFS transporter [Acidiferrimicrobium sp. IK]
MDRNLRIILIGRSAVSVARAIAGVVTALYLAAVGFSALEIGTLFLVVTVVSAVISTAVGMTSDRVGRKPYLVGVPLLAAVSAGVFALSRNPVLLFVFAALGSFGRGQGAGGGTVGPYQPAESAFVAETVPSSARPAAFGRLAFVASAGAVVGSLLAGLARDHRRMSAAAAMASYRPAFIAAGALAAVAAVAALWLREPSGRWRWRPLPAPMAPGRPANRSAAVPAPGPARAEKAGRPASVTNSPSPENEAVLAGPVPPGPARRSLISWPRRSWPALWRLWVTNGVNGLGIGLLGPFLSYWLARRYGAGPGTIGLLFALVNLGSLVTTLTAAGVGRRLGTVRAIVAVRAIGGALTIPMVLAPTFWLAGAIFFVRMMAQRTGMPLRQSFTQDLAHPDERSSVAALSLLPAQGTMAASQVLAGYLFDEVGLAAPFELSAVFQLANAGLYGLLFGPAKPKGGFEHLDEAAPVPVDAAAGHHETDGA